MDNKRKKMISEGSKKVKQFLFSRLFVVLLLLAVQVVFLVLLWRAMREHFFYSYWLTTLLNFFVFIIIVNRKGNPGFKLAWMIPITLLPIFGILLYCFCEYERIPRLVDRRLKGERQKISVFLKQDREVFRRLEEESPETANLSRYLYREMEFPVYENTDVRYFTCGEEFFPHLLEELEKAESYIFMEYFAFSEGKMWNTILDILKQKAAQGVEVRFLYDGTCSFKNPYNYAKQLEKYGIHAQVFNQIRPILSTVQNNRDHRKITVVDGRTAFTGGINLEDAYINAEVRYGYWKDTVIQLKGDAVKSFTAMFLQSWDLYNESSEDYMKYLHNTVPAYHPAEKTEGFVMPYCDSPLDTDNTGESVYMDILYNAKRYVHIMTPYLILDNEMVTALTYAAKRGVDVKILMPGIPDKPYAFAVAKTFYPELLKAGGRIFQFAPGFLHAKSFVADDEKAVVGTINLDYRSLYLHFECAAFFCRMEAVRQVEEDFQRTLGRSREVTLETCRKEKTGTKIYGRLLRLIAPLM